VTTLWAVQTMFDPRQGQVFFFLPPRPDRLWDSDSLVPIQLLPELLFLEVKWPGRESHHSLPSSAKVKNVWSHTSISHTYLWRSVSLITRASLPY